MTVYNWLDYSIQSPTSVEVSYIANSFPLESSLTRQVQSVTRPGSHWRVRCSWNNIVGEQRSALLGLLARLNGVEHRLTFPLFGHKQYGLFGGAPQVDGAGQSGNTLNIDGLAPNITGWIKAGDVFQLETSRTIHMATVDADSDGLGNATIEFSPALRVAPGDNTALVVVPGLVTGQFMLLSPPLASNSSGRRLSNGDLFSPIEAEFMDDVAAL